jgi:hypothetical protein
LTALGYCSVWQRSAFRTSRNAFRDNCWLEVFELNPEAKKRRANEFTIRWRFCRREARDEASEREWHEREDESIPPWMDEEEITRLEYEDDEEEEEKAWIA